jgi:hypothetical protein
MNFEQHHQGADARLRFLYGASERSRNIDSGATYGDIARMVNESRRQLHGNPIAIHVTLGQTTPDARVIDQPDTDIPSWT